MVECTGCKAQFTCGVAAGSTAACWCQAHPPLMPSPSKSASAPQAQRFSCFCPSCLQTLLAFAADKSAID
ncbi:cysteine-rich CWC family protein [Glaciimonas sp. PAMC28666]|uniref:cysteine-rich CWC family protein n=1 Tax=Glaciimonas sp. PAMC28666 TaxID=2807626 RepID=UPI00351C0BB1